MELWKMVIIYMLYLHRLKIILLVSLG